MTLRRSDLLLTAAAAVWGVSFVVVKDALTSASPLLFLAARFSLATVVLAPFINLFIRLGISPDAVTLVGPPGVTRLRR